MPDIQPIKDYVAAVDSYNRGGKKKASRLLAKALGADKASPVIEGSIKQFLTKDTLANDIVLTLVATESGKGKK